VLTFSGTLVLFTGTMIALWRTNKAASTRQKAEIEAKRLEGVADRASARAYQLRVEVAAILAERPTTLDSQRRLFEATFQHRVEVDADTVSPAERSRKVLDVRQLHIEHSDKLEHLVIRALLLTTDANIEAALSKVRSIAHNWNEPMLAAQSEPNNVEKFDGLRTRLTTALDELETATRKLTAIESDAKLTAQTN
jgi:hypothetical protein